MTPVQDQPHARESERKHRRVSPSARVALVSGGALTVLIVLALVLPVPFIKLSPGPTYNVIGDVDGAPLVQITGTQTFPTTGELDMTTVLELGGPRGGLTFVDAMGSWFNPSDAVLPRELLYPDDVSGEDVKQRQAAMFSSSQSNAIAAAARYLGRPVRAHVVVNAVFADSPSQGSLLPGDRILKVNGRAVSEPADVSRAVRGQPAGTTFTIEVMRDQADSAGGAGTTGTTDSPSVPVAPEAITVTSEPNPDDPAVPYIGISVGVLYTSDFNAAFALHDIGGPSAGLMFTTGIVDRLTPGDLADGRHIAGTGTIDPDGTVGPIGGIRQKLAGARAAGAELFVMPRAHCAEAEGFIPDGLTVVPVGTLSDAIAAITDWTAGRAVDACPVNGA